MQITALDIYTTAIVIDSAVTLGVGYWLNRTAKKQVKAAVDEIGPAIRESVAAIAEDFKRDTKQEIARSIQKLIPLILKGMKNGSRSATIRPSEHSTITESDRTGEHECPDAD